MKTVKFAQHLVPLVLSGEKTTTWRFDDEKDLQAGDIVTFIRRPELTSFAKAELIDVWEKPFGEITDEDKKGHEDVGDKEKMFAVYKKYYDKELTSETRVKIIRFRLLKD